MCRENWYAPRVPPVRLSGENASPSDQTSIRLNPDRIDADATVLRRRRTHEYRVRLPVPRSINKGLIAELLSDTKRRVIVTVNNAGGAQQAEVAITPRYRGSKGFRGITFAVRPRDQRPAQFGHSFDRRHDIPLKICETEFTDIAAGSLLLHRPIAVAQQSPVSTVGQYPNPCSLRWRRVAYGVADNGRVRPHGHAICEIIGLMGAEAEALCFDDRGNGVAWR